MIRALPKLPDLRALSSRLPRSRSGPREGAFSPPVRFLLSLAGGGLLAASPLGPLCAPFGLAFLGAAGAGVEGLGALLGASWGYFLSLGLMRGLRYLSSAILVYALSFAFYDLKIYGRVWFMPLSVVLLTALTGLLTLSGGEGQALALPAECVLAGLGTLLLRPLFRPGGGDLPRYRRISWASLLLMAAPGTIDLLGRRPGLFLALAALSGGSLLLPRRAGRARDRPPCLPQPGEGGLSRVPSYSQRQVMERLRSQSLAYQTLWEDMRRGLEGPKGPQDPRLEQVFDRAAEQVCQDCIRRPLCWKQDYHDTYQALRQLLTATRERGYGKLSDAPAAFQKRCGRGEELVSAANVEYAALLHRRQLEARLRASRAAVWQQYSQLAQLLDQAARELEEELEADPEQALPVLRFLRRHGLTAELSLGRDRRGRLVLQLTGRDLSPLKEGTLLSDLSRNMGMDFARGEPERWPGRERLTLVQEDKLQATAGVAALSRQGQSVSGDGGNWFRDREGTLWVVLCDGMGSGPGAARQSRLALKLLEDFLRAGVSPELALTTLSGALALRGEQELGFTTIDLLGLDLFTGQCRSYKLGAGPTYLRQNGQVKRLMGSSLPAGLEFGRESRPDVRSFQISKGDLIVLVSDGIADGEGDDWLWQRVRLFQGESPRELAHQILEESPGGRDDRTVIVLQLRERPLMAGKKPAPKRVQEAG